MGDNEPSNQRQAGPDNGTMTARVFDAGTLTLSGLRLIEASAGTGKTFSLAGLYLRLIVERQASVRDILVMTFTRAATQELRERIRARLVDAARIAHEPSLADPANAEHCFTQGVLAAAVESSTTVARRLADAAGRDLHHGPRRAQASARDGHLPAVPWRSIDGRGLELVEPDRAPGHLRRTLRRIHLP